MCTRPSLRLVILVGVLIISASASAQVPQMFSYQGVLANADGTALEDGSHTLLVRLYDEPENGGQLWEETHDVTTVSGVFSILLGSKTEFGLVFDRPFFLSVSVDGADEQVPRIPLTASPYSLGTKTTVAEPEAGHSFAVRNEDGNTAHLLSIDGSVSHAGLGTFDGGVVVFSADTSLSVAGKNAATMPDVAIGGTGVRVGVAGKSPIGIGVQGLSTTGTGVRGRSGGGVGVEGRSEEGPGVLAVSVNLEGVLASSRHGIGVHGISRRLGVKGEANDEAGIGVEGIGRETGTGVFGTGDVGVRGHTFGLGVGVKGESDAGVGVEGSVRTGTGVRGEGSTGVRGTGLDVGGTGVSGSSEGANGRGVIGVAFGDGGVGGDFTGGIGIRAQPTAGGTLAAELLGKVLISDVEPDPQEERVLVWSDDDIVRFKTLSDGTGGVPWFLEDNVIVTDNDVNIKDDMVTITDDEVTIENARFKVKNFEAEDVFIYDPNALEGNVNLALTGTMNIQATSIAGPAFGLQNNTGIGVEVEGDVGVSGSGATTGVRGFSSGGIGVDGLTQLGIGVFGKSHVGGEAVRGNVVGHGTFGALGFTSFSPHAGVRGHGGGSSTGGSFSSEEGVAGSFTGDVAIRDRVNFEASVLSIDTVIEDAEEVKFLVWDSDGTAGVPGAVRFRTLPAGVGDGDGSGWSDDGTTTTTGRDVLINGGSFTVNSIIGNDAFSISPTNAGVDVRIDGSMEISGPVEFNSTAGQGGIFIDANSTSKSVEINNQSSNLGLGINAGSLGLSSVSFASGGTGVQGVAMNGGAGVRGVVSGDGVAGDFQGDVSITDNLFIGNGIQVSGEGTNFIGGDLLVQGNVSKGGGEFLIDHPLDPENKYLRHSFVESPDMMNVYNGNVVLDADGEAWIELPEWFEALNKDFRYQLTCIGGFSQIFVAEKVSDNRFKIAGGSSGLEVSWQITGIRDDPYARMHRIQVEEVKPLEKRGTLHHPKAYGQ